MGVTRLGERIMGPAWLNADWRFRREGWCGEPIDYARAEAAE